MRYIHPFSSFVLIASALAGCGQLFGDEPGDGVVIIDDVSFQVLLDQADARLPDANAMRTLDDLDGDGLQELIVQDNDDKTRTKLYLDLDAPPLYITTTADALDDPTFTTHDLDGDGDNELLVMSSGLQHVDGATSLDAGVVLIFDGPLSPGSSLDEESADRRIDLITSSFSGSDGELRVADLDGDGALDLLLWNGAFIKIYSDAFAAGKTAAPQQGRIRSDTGDGPSTSWKSVRLGDFDGDGVTDIAAVSATLGGDAANLSFYMGPLDPDAVLQGVEASDAVWQLGKVHWGAEDTLTNLGDADGGGRDALAVSAFEPVGGADEDTEYAGVVYVVDGAPEGSKPIWDGAIATYEGVNEGDQVGKHIAAGDVDDDGELDLIITNSRNDGGLLFGPAVPRPVYIVHGPHSGESSLADADDTIWETSTSDYIDLGGVATGHFTRSAGDDMLLLAGGLGELFHFER